MPNTNPKLIYIVDDDRFSRKIYLTKLTQEGFIVKEATNGEEGLELLRQKKPDLLLLDLVMPKMNGFDVLEAMHEDPNLKDTKTIVFSSLGQSDDIERCYKYGIYGYLVKATIDVNSVVNKVKDAVADES